MLKCSTYPYYTSNYKDLYLLNTPYSFHFNGQETDDEIAGKGNINTAEYWEYDTRLGRRWNRDPKPDISVSDYVCFRNNPIWLNDIGGDSSVVNNFGDLLHRDDKDLRVFQLDNKKLNYIGEIGKTIDVTKIVDNLLIKNKEKAKGMDIIDFAVNVKKGSDWDYKNNEKTIFGLAWTLDQKNTKKENDYTKFKWGASNFEDASDFGNFHFGFVGSYAYGGKGIPIGILTRGAGFIEIMKDIGEGNLLDAMKGAFQLKDNIAPYGDELDDHINIILGAAHAGVQKSKQR